MAWDFFAIKVYEPCFYLSQLMTVPPGCNVLARHALWRYDNAFLQNENAIRSFQITLFSMSNNCLFGVMITGFCNVINCSHNSVIRSTKYRYRRRTLSLLSSQTKSKPDEVEDHTDFFRAVFEVLPNLLISVL